MCSKLIASFVIIFGCGAIGLRYVFIQRKRIEQLHDIDRMLAYICDEIRCNHRILSETFRNVSSRCGKPLCDWLLEIAEEVDESYNRCFSDLWIAALDRLVASSFLEISDMKELESIGHAFAGSDVLACVNNITVEKEHLLERIGEAEKELMSKSRIGLALSVTTGILMVILLW